MTLQEELASFLRAAARQSFAWGQRDCCLWPCEWIALRYGSDPAAQFRARYLDALGCYRILSDAGGLPALARNVAGQCGFVEVEEPIIGNLVLARLNPRKMIFGYSLGICVNKGRYAFKAQKGVTVRPCEVVAAWGTEREILHLPGAVA